MQNSPRITISELQRLGLELYNDDDTVEALFGGSGGGGKSVLLGMLAVQRCIDFPGVREGIGRKDLSQLKKTTLTTLLGKVHGIYGISQSDFRIKQDGTIQYTNGSEIIPVELDYYPSDPDFNRLGSLEISDMLIDEAGELVEQSYNAIRSRVGRWMNDKYGFTGKVFATCNPSLTFIRQYFYDPYDKMGGGRYQRWQMGNTVVNGKTIPAYRAFIRSSVYDNPFIESAYIERLKSLPDKERKRLLDGNWNYADDESSLFQSTLMDKATAYELPEHSEKFEKYIGVDVSDKGCFDDETEILTENGWKLFEDLTMEDKLLVRGEDGISKYDKILQIHKYEWDDDLYYYETPRLSFAVTPNHRMLARQSLEKDNQLIEIQDIKWKHWKVCRTVESYECSKDYGLKLHFVSKVKMPNGGFRTKEWNFTKEDWFEFIGWFASEGSVVEDRGQLKINISQKQGTEKSKHIEELLVRMGIKHTNIANNFSFYNREIAEHLLKEVGHLAPNKRIPQYIRKEQEWKYVERFLDGFCMGDGLYRKDRRQSYYSTSKELLGDIQEILAHFNRAGKLIRRNRAGSKFTIEGRVATRRYDCWALTECRMTDTEIGQTTHPVKKYYKGYVYCASTPTKTLFVRRNGTCYWTGNSDKTIFTLIDNGVLVSQKPSTIQMNWDSKSELPLSRLIADELIEFAQRNGFSQRESRHIAVECNGVGVGLRDCLKERGWYLTEYIATHKSRSQGYYQLMLDMDSGEVKMLNTLTGLDELRKQLAAHTYEMVNQEPSVIKKDKIKQSIGRSPDNADSFMIANWVRNQIQNPQNDPHRNMNRLGV